MKQLINLAKRWVKIISVSMFSIVLIELQGTVEKTTNLKIRTKWFGMCRITVLRYYLTSSKC